jgi:hypothetical protein
MDISSTRDLTDRDALVTYQTLRIGMVGAVGFLASAILIEIVRRGAVESSISAYWYTPVRPVFVGTLIAIGIALIVIKGPNAWEDTFLNFAGLFAPIVALVPTRLPGQDDLTDADTLALVENNVGALLVIGALGIAASVILRRGDLFQPRHVADVVRLWGTAALYGVTLLVFVFVRSALTRWGHDVSAIGMFACMAVVVYITSRREDVRSDWLRRAYQWIAGIMLVTLIGAAVLRIVIGFDWTYLIFAVEVVEIGAFVVFWALQTREHWRASWPAGTAVGTGTLR